MNARRSTLTILASLCVLAGGLLSLNAPALALELPAAPTVENESVVNVKATSATFQAEVNAHGANTEYHFEYGRCASLGSCATSGYEGSLPFPDASLGSAFAVQDVSVHTQDLLAGAVYHFRVVAHNEMGAVEGEEKMLTTQTAGVLALPDGRSWEMVSPPQKEGGQLGPIQREELVQASASGNAIVDWASVPTEATPAGSAWIPQVFFGRGPSAWSSQVISPRHETPTGPSIGKGVEFRFFSEDLSKGILQPFGNSTPLSPEATEATPYLRADYFGSNAGEQCITGCYQPLFTAANVPAGTKFGEEPYGKCEHFTCGPFFLAGTPDLSHLLLRSTVDLTGTPAEGFGGLYELTAGKAALVNLLPSGEVNEKGGPVAAFPSALTRHSLSSDGSRIIWEAENGSQKHLYLRDMVKGETVRLDVANAGVPPRPVGSEYGEPVYMIASADASRIFFKDHERLTEDSTPGANAGRDLYEYNLNAPAGSRVTDLTVDSHPNESADVSIVTGASEDGSYVYFTADGALAPGATPGRCGNGPETKVCNLYVRHGGTTTFVAALAGQDAPDWNNQLSSLSGGVSPNGRWMAFMSSQKLTGYNTTDALSGHPDEELYLYDANAGRLICASCNPTGARPVGIESTEEGGAVLSGTSFEKGAWLSSAISSLISAATGKEFSGQTYLPRYLSDSGRLFFDSHDALVPQDVNGTWDVYQYEPAGIGDCSSSKTTFSERSSGCVAPVSSGTANEESTFLDASKTGGDVFFLTTAKLLPQDFDNAFDIYDAHECSVQSPCIAPQPVTPPPCNTGDSCKPAPTPQPEIFGSPASSTFAGAGNVSPSAGGTVVKPRGLTRGQKLARALHECHRKKGKRRAMCERHARKLYEAKPVRKANATKRGRG